MFDFLKKFLGYPTKAEQDAAKAVAEAPYKVEPVKEVVETAPVAVPVAETALAAAPLVAAVNDQITDAVTQTAPAPKAKKKPATKKPSGEKKAAAKKPGRKPKSAKA